MKTKPNVKLMFKEMNTNEARKEDNVVSAQLYHRASIQKMAHAIRILRVSRASVSL